MTSTENVNKLCLFVQETDRTFAGQTSYDGLSRANIKCLQLHRRRVHSDSAFRKHELAGRMLMNVDILRDIQLSS